MTRAGRTGLRRAGLTSRAAVLALVLCALVVMLADPLQTYLRQRSQLAQQRAQNSALQRKVDSLEAQQRLWADPAYVREQARKRLYYVMPGETAYVVVGPSASAKRGSTSAGVPAASKGTRPTVGTANGNAGAKAKAVSPVPAGTGTTWYGRLWSTVRAAGQPVTAAPSPTARRPANPPPVRPGNG